MPRRSYTKRLFSKKRLIERRVAGGGELWATNGAVLSSINPMIRKE